MGLIKPGLLLVVLLTASACGVANLTTEEYIPIYSPAITGVVTRNGSPAPDVDLVLAVVSTEASNCYFEKLSATTDAEGNFRIEPLLASEAGELAKESEYRWQVCIKTDAGNSGIWYDSIIGRLSPNDQTRLICEMSGTEPGAVCESSDGKTFSNTATDGIFED